MDQIDQEANNNSSSDGNTSFFKTLFNGLNAIIGVGLLSMPYALASGGWLSLILLLAISGAAGYAGVLTKRCMDANPKIKTYADIGEAAFGKLGKTIVSIVLYVDLYLVLTGYLILEGDNLHNLFPNMNIHMKGISIGGKQSFVIIIAVALLPTVWLDNLSILAYISATGVVSALLILGSVLSVGVFDGVGFHNKGELLNWKGVPMAMSLYMFSYSANPVFPTLYTSMKKKHHFSKVVVVATTRLAIASVAVFAKKNCKDEGESCGFREGPCCSDTNCIKGVCKKNCKDEGDSCGFGDRPCCSDLNCIKGACKRKCNNEGDSCGFRDGPCCSDLKCIKGACKKYCNDEGDSCGFRDGPCCSGKKNVAR
uniref:Amino acid transporter transmembrane domain-containing protein n=1 Tax=Chenopodium quinoa TaxID=63459 RepID=A0A803M7S5_CHEQI